MVNSKYWLDMAYEDYYSAKILKSYEKYAQAVFLCQQCIEKALKYVLYKYGIPVRGHNLLELYREIVKNLGVENKEIEKICRKINPFYTVSRYPDAANGLPSEFIDLDDVEFCLKGCEKVLKWVESL